MADKDCRILVVDDEQVVRHSLREWFTEDGYPVRTAADGVAALAALAEEPADLLLVDIRMPGMDGLELQRRIREATPEAAIIIVTAYGAVDTAVQALKEGAYDYVTKPVDPDELGRIVVRAAEHQKLSRDNARLRQRIEVIAEGQVPTIIGDSPAMVEVRRTVATVAETDTAVLIVGDSGTGKEQVSRAVHSSSRRRRMPLVTVHCAGLSEGGLEDQLLWNGSRAGEVRAGKFEQAHGGTLFFKDVGEISPASQINLLRALEEKPVVSAAGARLVPADFRILAATHRDLGQMVEDGTFRLDLLYRFNVLSIELPLLRDRPQDIPLLAQFFLRRKAQQLNRPASHFSPDALFRMQEYDWPGNVRELENAVERAVVVQLGETLQADDLPLPEADLQPLPSLAEVEHRHIERVLQATEGNVSRAARVLGIDRVTLYSKIRKFNIPRP